MKKCLIILALVCCSGAQAQTAAAASPNASALQVVSSSFSTNDGMVTVLAEVKNTADIKASEVVLEARLKDADGKLIDVISEQSYGFVVPAGQQLAVRLFERAGAPVAKYATAEVKVVDAEFRRACAQLVRVAVDHEFGGLHAREDGCAQLRADAGRFAGTDGDQRLGHCSSRRIST